MDITPSVVVETKRQDCTFDIEWIRKSLEDAPKEQMSTSFFLRRSDSLVLSEDNQH